MVRSQYFCDRCKGEVTNAGGRFALYPLEMKRLEHNTLKLELCSDCVFEVTAFLASPPAPKEGD